MKIDENKAHTPEPWSRGYGNYVYAGDRDGPLIATCMPLNGTVEELERAFANARRIAACVNACAGIDTDSLEQRELAEIKQQRDELLGALKDVLADAVDDDVSVREHVISDPTMIRVIKAINKSERCK